MLKEEFEDRIGHPVSAEDYELIDRVYTWYPGIYDKDDIVKIYALLGMTGIKDLTPRCLRLIELEKEQREAAKEFSRIKGLIKDVEAGGDLIDNRVMKDAMHWLDDEEEIYDDQNSTI